MSIHTLPSAESDPDHISCNMQIRPKQRRPKSTREHNANEIVYWVEVLSANAHCVHEIMVHLVEIRIEKLVVHQFVEEVKSNIFCDHQEDQLREKLQGIR